MVKMVYPPCKWIATTICESERRKYLESNDVQTLMEYLKNKQVEDPSFFYVVQLDDDDGTIMNIFWADGQAIMDCSVFGDAISFDTTFSTNKFKMSFAPLIGVNHHKQTILFGAALLYNLYKLREKWAPVYR
jgi:zinc finger SWIM domain-containing protein 3